MATNIYILKLQGGKYYVGKSADPDARIQQHFAGKGSSWTQIHKPIKVEKVIRAASTFDEDRYVKEYMSIHGIDKVRGGSYVTTYLDEIQEAALKHELRGASDACTICGRKGHFAASCYAQKKTQTNGCYRCGRRGHYASNCYARTTVDDDSDDDDSDDSDDSDDDDDDDDDDDSDY